MCKTLLISVIIPFYNTDWIFFKKCLDSICSQRMTVSDFEVILVDDCSTDKEMVQKCREYIAYKPEFVMIINFENKGVSWSRNRGIDRAQGKFLMFVDSDDWLVPNAFEALEEIILREDPDTVFYDYVKTISGKEVTIKRNLSAENYSRLCEPMLIRLVISMDFNSPCISLYSRDIQKRNKLYFKDGVSMGEDFLFNISYLDSFQKGVYLEKELYVYRSNEAGATHTFSLKHAHDSGEGYYYRKRMLEKYFPDRDRYRGVYRTFYANSITGIRQYLLSGILAEGMSAVDECLEIPWIKDALEDPVEGIGTRIMKTIIKKRMYFVLFLLSKAKKLRRKKF